MLVKAIFFFLLLLGLFSLNIYASSAVYSLHRLNTVCLRAKSCQLSCYSNENNMSGSVDTSVLTSTYSSDSAHAYKLGYINTQALKHLPIPFHYAPALCGNNPALCVMPFMVTKNMPFYVTNLPMTCVCVANLIQ